jgi:hypothetical protein
VRTSSVDRAAVIDDRCAGNFNAISFAGSLECPRLIESIRKHRRKQIHLQTLGRRPEKSKRGQKTGSSRRKVSKAWHNQACTREIWGVLPDYEHLDVYRLKLIPPIELSQDLSK